MSETIYRKLALSECAQAGDVVVVIDVLRAFSTEAVAFEQGVREIVAVGSVEDALAWKTRDPQALLMGEVNGYRVAGFDLWNSPSELLKRADLRGRRLVHRTTAGTQGILCCRESREVLAASFLVARATAGYLAQLAVPQVDIILTGQSLHRDGDEDEACADYIIALLRGEAPQAADFIARVHSSGAGKRFMLEDPAEGWREDLALCTQVDRCPLYMPVYREGEDLILRAVWA